MAKPNENGLHMQQIKDMIVRQLDIRRFYLGYLTVGELSSTGNHDGWSDRVPCPIHGNDNTPNFFVNLNTGNFKCFSCQQSGSVFDFWMLRNGKSLQDKRQFWESILALATEAGIDPKTFGSSSLAPRLPAKIAGNGDEKLNQANQIPKLSRTAEHDSKHKPITKDHYRLYAKQLESQHYKYLAEKRGLTLDTIKEYEIGYNPRAPVLTADGVWKHGRLCIPVIDHEGECRNIRMHSASAEAEFKMVNYVIDKGKPTELRFGSPARLFNLNRLSRGNYEHIVFTEGEWDAILLNQRFREANYDSWLAVTGTAGANTFLPEWLDYMEGKKLYACLDCDEAGKVAVLELATKFWLPALESGKLKDLRIVTLPLEGSKESKDISDFFLKAQLSVEDFVQLCISTPETVAGGVANDDASVQAIEVESLDTVLRERRFIDKKVTVPLTIISAAEKIYHAIRSYKVVGCPLLAKDEDCCSADAGERHIPYGHSMFIESCMESEEKIFSRLRRLACQKDQKCKIETVRKVVMEQYFAHQVVERPVVGITEDGVDTVHAQSSSEMTHVSIYFLQPDERVQIEPKNYKAVGWIRTHPKTCVATFFVEQLIQVEADWRKFTMANPENRQAIQAIQAMSVDDIVNDINNGVTRIFHADEILYAILLTYLSPLYFDFNGTRLRGWITCLIVGDSGVGKSATYIRFSDWVQIGNWFSALSGSRTGLVYSTKQKNGEWYTAAGDYVKSTDTIIAVDETQALAREDTQCLGNAIDRGFLEVKKVASGGYMARVRAIFLLNPKDIFGRQAVLSDFPNGCESLINVFETMFIRRVDIAIFRSRQEQHDYNKYVGARPEDQYKMQLTSGMMKSLIYWAWTREPRQIIFSEAATRRCLSKATELSCVFGEADKVPLVSPNDFRENLARLSVAFAILSRNFTQDLESVEVLEEHVDTVAGFIDALYSSPECNLRELSRAMGRLNRLVDAEWPGLKEFVTKLVQEDMQHNHPFFRETYPTVRMLLLFQQVGKLAVHEAPTVLGVSLKWVQRRCTQLQSVSLLKPGERNTFLPTRKFNLMMVKWRQDPAVDKLLESVHQHAAEYASRHQQYLPNEDEPGAVEFPRETSQPQVSNSRKPF